MSEKMKAIHKDCFDFLMHYRKDNNELFFLPRIDDDAGMKKGYYFRGNDNYLVLSFWNGYDLPIFIINFSVQESGRAAIELSLQRGSPKQMEILQQLKSILISKFLFSYNQDATYAAKWVRKYDSNTRYEEALKQFIENEKPVIDEFINKNPKLRVTKITKEDFEKAVKTAEKYWNQNK